jgi:MFS transporter, PPP family, 3-phenylpropionic acid transporter
MGGCSILSGMLYDTIGARGYWVMAALSLAGGALALLLLPGPPRRPRSTLP